MSYFSSYFAWSLPPGPATSWHFVGHRSRRRRLGVLVTSVYEIVITVTAAESVRKVLVLFDTEEELLQAASEPHWKTHMKKDDQCQDFEHRLLLVCTQSKASTQQLAFNGAQRKYTDCKIKDTYKGYLIT